MASVTKPFVATSIVQLLEQEKLSLDDPVVKYLPYFEMKDERYDTLTIRQFLTHSSGMPDVEDYHWDEPEHEGRGERLSVTFVVSPIASSCSSLERSTPTATWHTRFWAT